MPAPPLNAQENTEAKALQELLAEIGPQPDVDAILKKLVRTRKKELELQGELAKKDEQLAESLAERKTEKALADTERKRAELKLAEAMDKQKQLLAIQAELEANVAQEKAQATKTELSLRGTLAQITAADKAPATSAAAPATSSAQEKEARALRSQVQVLTAERDMLKSQVEKQATRIDALMRESEEAVNLRRRTREQESALEQLTATATGADDRDAIIAQLRSEVAHLAKADERCKVLQQEANVLRERVQNTQVLREQASDLKKRLEKAEKLAQKAEQLQVENEALTKERNAWNASVASGPFPEATSPAQINRIVSDLRKENEVLLEKNGNLTAELKRLQLRAADSNAPVETRADVQSAQLQAKQAIEARKKLEQAYALLQRERDNMQAVLDTFAEEEPTDTEKVLKDRVAMLEKALAEKTSLMNEMMREGAARPAEAESLKKACETVKGELAQLQVENQRLVEELGRAETKLARGEFDPKTTKILHLAINPESRALASKEKLELEALRQENASLRSASAGQRAVVHSSSLSEEDLKRQVHQLEVKYDRLSKAFKKQMRDVREASYQLFGYALDIDYAEGTQTYRVRCMYADSDNDFLVFCSSREGIQLLDSEWGRTLNAAMERYLINEHSIPAFLSAVLLEQFERKTQS